VLPFAASISVLTLAQALTIGLPAWDPLPLVRRLRGSGWALLPPLSIAAVVGAVGAAATVAQGLTYLALVAVPPLAAVALGRAARIASPRRALTVVPLFAIAWLDRGGLVGEAAALALSALSCVTLGVLLVELAPWLALKLGVVAMALVDTGLVVANLLQAPNSVLNAAHPVAGLPQLQRVVFGSGLMGYGDLFIAAVVGAMLAVRPPLQRRGVVVAAVLGLLFDLLFFAVDNLPATVPIAATLILLDRGGAAVKDSRARRRIGSDRRPSPQRR
jgi:hypothetical protein